MRTVRFLSIGMSVVSVLALAAAAPSAGLAQSPSQQTRLASAAGNDSLLLSGSADSATLGTYKTRAFPIPSLWTMLAANPRTFSANFTMAASKVFTFSATDTVVGTFAFRTGSGQTGSVLADTVPSGYVGEFKTVQLTASSANLSTGTPFKCDSASVGPGDWDTWAVADYVDSSATTTLFSAGLDTNSTTTLPGQDLLAIIPLILTTNSASWNQVVPHVRMNLNVTHEVYLVCQASFSAGGVKTKGTIYARRIR